MTTREQSGSASRNARPPAAATAPLTSLQQALAVALNVSADGREVTRILWRFPSSPSVERLTQAWRDTAVAHDALRLSFTLSEPGVPPFQQAESTIETRIQEINTPLPPEQRSAALEQFLEQDQARNLELGTSPCWRLTLLRYAANDCVLVWTVPHVLLDDYSLGLVLTEVVSRYHDSASVPTTRPKFIDYAIQRSAVEQDASIEWWSRQLSGLPQTASLPHSSGATHREVARGLTLPDALSNELSGFSRSQGVGFGTLVKGAWILLLLNQTSSKDSLIGQIVTNRTDRDDPKAVTSGMLANILPLRVPVDTTKSVSSLLQDIATQEQGVEEHATAPLDRVLKTAGYRSNAGIFESVINFEEEQFLAPARLVLGPGEALEAVRRYSIPIVVNVTRLPELRVRLYVREDILESVAAERLLAQFAHILKTMAANPDRAIRELEWIEPNDRHYTVEEFNRTEGPIEPGLLLHQTFERLAASHPHRLAVVGPDETLTYGELDRRANQLAHYLIAQGVKPHGRIMLCVEKSARLLIAMFATHKAGCAYVPVDPAWPRERVGGILANLDAEAFICSSEYVLNDLPGARTILLDKVAADITSSPDVRPEVRIDDTDVAYIIFTSGSTGTPKGVQIPHRGIVNTMQAFNTHFSYGPEDRVFCITACTFDPSIHDIFGILSTGGAVVLCPPAAGRDPELWGELIQKHRISSWCSVPQLVQMLFESHRNNPARLATLRVVRMGGDALPMSLPTLIWSICPKAEIANEGGVTEVSVCSTLQPVTHVDTTWQSVPYGRPLLNQSVYILDENLNPCPTLVSGDMYLGGRSLGKGYWKDDARTNAAYITHPKWQVRLYRAGDRGRFLDSGDLEFLGREDNQVKLGGFRIELGEIETAIRLLPWVKEVVVIKREISPGAESLVAYVVPHQESAFKEEAVREQCRVRLPHYMVPAIVVSIPVMPLTANGKVDRKALPAPLKASVTATQWSDEENAVADIWQEILGVRPDSPERSFFEAGGTSLLALRLVELVKRKTGHAYTIAHMYKVRPSIRRMAVDIATRQRRNTASPFAPSEEPVAKQWHIPMQPRGSRPPFFFIGPYHVLGRYFSSDQPYHAFHLNESVRKALPQRSFSDIAGLVLRELRRIQPQGPYHLGGYGFGAVVAFEIASILREKGEEVAYLAMVEPLAPAALKPPAQPSWISLRFALFGLFKGWFGGPFSWWKHYRTARKRHKAREHETDRALNDFRPSKLDRPIDLLIAAQSVHSLFASHDPRLAWRNWGAHVEVEAVRGNDYSVIREPAVETLSRVLEARLQRAQGSLVPSGPRA